MKFESELSNETIHATQKQLTHLSLHGRRVWRHACVRTVRTSPSPPPPLPDAWCAEPGSKDSQIKVWGIHGVPTFGHEFCRHNYAYGNHSTFCTGTIECLCRKVCWCEYVCSSEKVSHVPSMRIPLSNSFSIVIIECIRAEIANRQIIHLGGRRVSRGN